jgi:hypothetical protein
MINSLRTLHKVFIVSVLSLFFLASCGGEEPIQEIPDPELVAVAFFEALYNEKNVEKAASVCSPQLARIILHYKSPRAVARHLFNMSYDKVIVKPDDSGVKVREQFKQNAVVTLYFDGYYNEEHLKDVKQLAMVQKDGRWLIDKILKDPF